MVCIFRFFLQENDFNMRNHFMTDKLLLQVCPYHKLHKGFFLNSIEDTLSLLIITMLA